MNSFHDWGVAPADVPGATFEVLARRARRHGRGGRATATLPAGRRHVAPGARARRTPPTATLLAALLERAR